MNELQNFYEAHGFVKDCEKELFGKIFGDIKKIKEIHIDVYMDKPYMIFSRVIEKDVVLKNNNRIVVHKNDKYKTVIVNVPFNEIINCVYKKYADNQYEIIFNIQNVCYKMLVII